MKEIEKFGFGLLCGIGFMGVFLTLLGINPSQMEKKAKQEAIAHGAAHYEVDTNGVVTFKWNK